MALFERPSQHDVFALFRVGFAARLRWELSDTYITVNSKAELIRTKSRSASSVFFFVSNDTLPSSHTRNQHSKLTEKPWKSRTMLAAVLAQPPKSSESSFLTFSEGVPHLTDRPGLLKVSIPWGGESSNRTLVSLQRPGPRGTFLSLSGAKETASLVNSVSKRELFHMEIVPGSLGQGFVTSPLDQDIPGLSCVEALSQVLLELGIHFRLRSCHSRVLRKGDGDKSLVAIVQNGPKTSVQESNEKELVFRGYCVDTPVLRPRDYARGIYVIKDIESGMIVSVSKSNLALSRAKTLSESVAVLVPERNSVKPLCVQSRKDWGRIQLSKAETREGENFDRSQADQWLMAGPRGRLEVRSNQSSWESFTIEFVRQSFTVTIAGLLKSPLYDIASEATRSNIRMEIAAKVGKRDVLVGATQQVPKQKKKGGMDYSAALAGLADPPNVTKDDSKTTPHTKTAPNREKISTLKASSNAGVQATAASAVGTASASSALPRNQANRKAAKRKKKKQKAKNAKRNAAANVRKVNDASVMSASKGESVSASSLGSKGGGPDEGKPPPEQEMHSSSKENSRSGAGPPCAACGRGIEGTYTTALGKNFHPHCFCCGKCRRPMGAGAGQFRERGGVPYCQTCYAAHLASRCARCSQPIMDTVITAMEKTWHKECLTCTICRLPLTQTFWLYADKPNEPRCSRCVTGSEEYSGPRGRSGRMVNLPMFNRNNQQTLPVVGPTSGNGSSASGGRARLMNPVLPATTRR